MNIKSRKNVAAALRQHSNRKRLDFDPVALANAVSDETDRGATIMFAAIVEDALQERLQEKFAGDASSGHEKLFGQQGIISDFYSKIQIARAMELIDDDIHDMCEILREMRNACAHSRDALSFENEAMRDALRFLISKIAPVDDIPTLTNEDACTPMFAVAVAYISRAISTGSREKAAEFAQGLLTYMLEDADRELAKLNEEDSRTT